MRGRFDWLDLTVPRRESSLIVATSGIVLCEVYVNCWWAVDPATDDMLVWVDRHGYIAPQCNSDRRVAERLFGSYSLDREAEIRQVPMAFVPRRYDS